MAIIYVKVRSDNVAELKTKTSIRTKISLELCKWSLPVIHGTMNIITK